MLLLIYEIFISMVALFYLAIALKGPDIEQYLTSRDYRPRVMVMMPCKGGEIDLPGNLKSLMSQSYGDYETVAIIDDRKDGALPFIKESGMKWITTSRKFNKGSGKVNALATAMEKFGNYDIYVIADSDIRVGANWLVKLIAPLSDKDVGLSTSYPYFKAVGGFWSRVKTVWGFVGNGMMESQLLRFGWGGSLAFRRELIDRKTFDRFSRSVSDDIAITDIVKEKGLKLAYVPEANPMVAQDDDAKRFWEWANRQTSLSIRGNRRNFYAGVLFYLFDIVLLLSGILLAVFVSPWFLLALPKSLHKLWQFFNSSHK